MKRAGKRAIFYSAIIVFAIVFSINATGATAKEPSKREVAKVIQDHIEGYYMILPILSDSSSKIY